MRRRTEKNVSDKAQQSAPASVLLIDRSLLKPISAAIATAGVDFDELLAEFLGATHSEQAPRKPAQIGLADYFILLDRLARKTRDETFGLSKRPLMPGALHFALTRGALAPTIDEAMRSIATSFNMLHGGNYNHVVVRGGALTYAIDNTKFPYPFELNARQSHSLMECILVLMHTLFKMLSPERLEEYLISVSTRRRLASGGRAVDQLSYWRVPVRGRRRFYSLTYDIGGGALPVTIAQRDLPEPTSIYAVVAESIRRDTSQQPQTRGFAERVDALLRRRILTEAETAVALGVGRRTLRRRLAEEKTSYRRILDRRLNELAYEMLSAGRLAAEVADALGYADERSFRRAFVRWNKRTPSNFRAD